MRYRTLGRTGLSVSVIGFGASPLGNVFGPVDSATAERAIHSAADRGINLFDVSPYYGATLAETRLGQALRGRRHSIVLATKAGRYGDRDFDFSAKRIAQSLDESLERLQTDYLDIFHLHDIEFGEAPQILNESIPALQEARRAGKVRFIGVTGYPLPLLRRVVEGSELDVVLSYCHYNLLADDLNELLLPAAQERNMGLINASPLHMGVLTPQGPPAWHPASGAIRQAGREMVDYCRQQQLDLPMVALRFCLDHSYVASTLIGMGSEEEVRSNLRALDIAIDPALLERLQAFRKPERGNESVTQ